MMQEFKPDCTINLHLESKGKPSKYAWVCSVSSDKQKNIVVARGFLGITSIELAQALALQFALRFAENLRREKVWLCTSFPAEGMLIDDKKIKKSSRPQEARLQLEEVKKIWESIRLKRWKKIEEKDLKFLREEVNASFAR